MIAKTINIILDILILILVIVIIMIIVIAGILYLPFQTTRDFRDLYVETAMTTFNHQWMAQMFFDQKTINNIVTRNIAPELEENTNHDIALEFKEEYIRENKIDIEVIKGDKFEGRLITVSDPAKIKVAVTESLMKTGEQLEVLVKKSGAVAGINGSGFVDYNGTGRGGVPVGIIIKDGEIVYFPGDNGKTDVVGFTYDDILVVGKYTLDEIKELNLRDAVSPFYILTANGVNRIQSGNGGYGIQPRTAIGQTLDGTVLLLTIDGRQLHSLGATMKQVQDVMSERGAINVASLDGGSSSTMYYMDQLVNKPSTNVKGGRWLPSAFVVFQ